jgi:hypothetical protein
MGYLATKTSQVNFGHMSYTPEKKRALQRVLTSQSAVVGTTISSLQDVNTYLSKHLTIDQLPIKAAMNRALSNLQYEKELIESFKEELSK